MWIADLVQRNYLWKLPKFEKVCYNSHFIQGKVGVCSKKFKWKKHKCACQGDNSRIELLTTADLELFVDIIRKRQEYLLEE